MALTYEFYLARAEEAAVEAQNARLDQVRERALRSEATWRGLAKQARGTVIAREKAAQEKAVRQEEEARLVLKSGS